MPARLLAEEWTTGDVESHIFAGGTLSWTTTSLPAVSSATVTMKFGLWNSPDVPLRVSLNGAVLGDVVATGGYISPGPQYVTWTVTSLLVPGTNTVTVLALSGGEAIVGRITITYTVAGTDADGDGHYAESGDCDDADAAVHPGADEACNGLDDDCDGLVPGEEADADGDGYQACAGDCDDRESSAHPGGDEVCDGLDNDCSGATDDLWDADGDGVNSCLGDCDETDPARYPGAPELCNGLDDDCDVEIPANEQDADGDGVRGCAGDCDDTSGGVWPGADELCEDDLDNDCDGDVDIDDEDCVYGATVCSCRLGEGGAGGGGAGGLALLALLVVVARRRRAYQPTSRTTSAVNACSSPSEAGSSRAAAGSPG